MEKYIVIGMLAVAVILGILSTERQFRGKAGCCGGGSYRFKRKSSRV